MGSLSLSNNKFKDVSTLEPLKDLQHLQHLDLEDNEFAEAKEDFRTKIFELLPNLEIWTERTRTGPRSTVETMTARRRMLTWRMSKMKTMMRVARRRIVRRRVRMVLASRHSMTTQPNLMRTMRLTITETRPRETTVTWRMRRRRRVSRPRTGRVSRGNWRRTTELLRRKDNNKISNFMSSIFYVQTNII